MTLSIATEMTKQDQVLIHDVVVNITFYSLILAGRTGKDRMCEQKSWTIHSASPLNLHRFSHFRKSMRHFF